MINFPTYIKAYWITDLLNNGSPPVCYDTDIIKIITDLNNTYNQGSNRLNKIESKDKKLQDISTWVYKNIILKILIDTPLTTSIKIRIASNMLRVTLNNDDLYKYCADSLVYNINALSNAILSEQLPF